MQSQILVAILVATNSAWADDISEILRKYKKSREPFSSCLLVTTQIDHIDDRGVAHPGAQVRKTKTLRVGDRVYCEQRMWRDIEDLSQLDQDTPHHMTKSVLYDDRLLTLQTTAQPKLFVAEEPPHYYAHTAQGPAISGYVYAAPIENLLENNPTASIRAQPEVLEGVECQIVELLSDSAKFEIWFAPTLGHVILRLAVTREGEALRREQEVHHAKLRLPPVDEVPARERWTKTVSRIEDIELEQHGGKWIPVGAVFSSHTEFEEGPPRRVRTVIRRETVVLNPVVIDGSFSLPVPDGTPVFLHGVADGIPRQWRNGEIVPREDKDATDRLRGHINGRTFEPNPQSQSKFWLAAIPSSMILALGAGAAIRLRLSSHSRSR